jgi:hypothetical protein
VTDAIFSGRCVRCGLALALHDEFATVEQFAALWLKAHACQGTKAAVPGPFEAAAAKHNADTAAVQANNGTRVDALCGECAGLGLKSSKGYDPKFWPNKKGGPDQCDGMDGSGQYLNHRRKPVTA